MSSGNKLFRESALNKMSSPEQLDTLMKVVTPKGWLALCTVFCILLVVVMWGFTGSIATTVQGMGVLVPGGGVFQVSAPTSGRVTDLSIRVGDFVEKGQVIARIANPKLLQEISQSESTLANLEEEYAYLNIMRSKEALLTGDEKSQKELNLSVRKANLLEQKKVAGAKLLDMKKLFQEGIVSKNSVHDAQEKLNKVEQTIATTSLEVGRLTIDETETQLSRKKESSSKKNKIQDTEEHLVFLREQLLREEQVRMPYAGRVVEMMISNRTMISAGDPVISIERSGKEFKEIELIAYVPAGDGKKVEMGMDMMIVLSTVKKEEYGSLVGKVLSVSKYPETSAGMLQTLGNGSLVKSMEKLGSSIMIVGDLIPEPDNISKYRWTSKDGAPVTLQNGTSCQVSISVRKQKPVTLVIPALKKLIGGA